MGRGLEIRFKYRELRTGKAGRGGGERNVLRGGGNSGETNGRGDKTMIHLKKVWR